MSDRNTDQLPFAERDRGGIAVRHADGRLICYVDPAGVIHPAATDPLADAFSARLADIDTRLADAFSAWLADGVRQFAHAVRRASDIARARHDSYVAAAYAAALGVAAAELAEYLGRVEPGHDAGAGVHRVPRRS